MSYKKEPIENLYWFGNDDSVFNQKKRLWLRKDKRLIVNCSWSCCILCFCHVFYDCFPMFPTPTEYTAMPICICTLSHTPSIKKTHSLLTLLQLDSSREAYPLTEKSGLLWIQQSSTVWDWPWKAKALFLKRSSRSSSAWSNPMPMSRMGSDGFSIRASSGSQAVY